MIEMCYIGGGGDDTQSAEHKCGFPVTNNCRYVIALHRNTSAGIAVIHAEAKTPFTSRRWLRRAGATTRCRAGRTSSESPREVDCCISLR